jgi:hypothetical protein
MVLSPYKNLVSAAGIEPARYKREILSLLCLPIPPRGHLKNYLTWYTVRESNPSSRRERAVS